MLLRLKQLFDRDGEKKDLYLDIPLEELGIYSGFGTFVTPISLRGKIENRAGVVTMQYNAQFAIHHQCDRCLNEFDREYSMDFEHILIRTESYDEDEYVQCPDDTLDVNELAISDLLLSLPSKILCKESCKGLCPKCGKNLNAGDCGCELDEQ